jgi:hypothetical protein
MACDDKGVTFKWKDYRIEGPERYKIMTLAAAEFIRRFLIHVLPAGFQDAGPSARGETLLGPASEKLNITGAPDRDRRRVYVCCYHDSYPF